jgi:hypothetical protein
MRKNVRRCNSRKGTRCIHGGNRRKYKPQKPAA